MNRSHLRPHVDEVRRYALAGARAELSRLLDLFPELRADVSQGDDAAGLSAAALRYNAAVAKTNAAVKSRTLKHWRKTAGATNSSATNGHSGSAITLSDAVRQSVTATPQSIADVTAKVSALGYQQPATTKTTLNSRVAQDLARLRKLGETRKTAKGWRAATGGAAK